MTVIELKLFFSLFASRILPLANPLNIAVLFLVYSAINSHNKSIFKPVFALI
jgi:hypothetical protein